MNSYQYRVVEDDISFANPAGMNSPIPMQIGDIVDIYHHPDFHGTYEVVRIKHRFRHEAESRTETLKMNASTRYEATTIVVQRHCKREQDEHRY